MNAFVIDAFEFCRIRERREGELAVSDLPRLAAESVNGFGTLRWSLQGDKDKSGHPQMTLSISGSVQLICQRCLTPFVFDIASDSVLILAPDEASADELDALLEDEPAEVIVGSAAFNIADLIEDEALLALPLSPKHEACPAASVPQAAAPVEEARVSPFDVLKKLKQ
jgi:uncharacterized protein